jgi:hypothetical protein
LATVDLQLLNKVEAAAGAFGQSDILPSCMVDTLTDPKSTASLKPYASEAFAVGS